MSVGVGVEMSVGIGVVISHIRTHTSATTRNMYVTHMNESCHSSEWVVPLIRMRDVTHMNTHFYNQM